MNIFLVDDDMIIRAGISKVIEKSNLDCTIVGQAADGELALEEIKKNEDIDLIITDIRMPIMDGLELIRQVRKFNSLVKIVVLSGFDDFKYVRNAFMDGAVDYLLKPVVKQDLLDLLAKIQQKIESESKEKVNEDASYHQTIKKNLYHLMHHRYTNEQEQNELIKMLGLATITNIMVMVLKADNYYKEIREQISFESILEESMVKLNNLFSLDKNYRFFSYIENNSIVILMVGEDQTIVQEVINKYYLFIKNTPLSKAVTFTLGVSGIFTNMNNLPDAYKQGVAAVEERFYIGKDSLIRFESGNIHHGELQIDGEEDRRNISLAFELCEYTKVKSCIEKMFHRLYGLNPREFRNQIKLLLESLILHVKDFHEALIRCDFDYEFFILNVNTVDELKIQLLVVSQTIIELIKLERDKRGKRRIEMAKNYINSHYKEAISLNDVSNYVELNASYFSSLFKKETNLNFSEYLLNTRMNAAKKLLLDPTIKVYEIGIMVGYEDAVSFGRAFKKKIGMSPKEYRNTVC